MTSHYDQRWTFSPLALAMESVQAKKRLAPSLKGLLIDNGISYTFIKGNKNCNEIKWKKCDHFGKKVLSCEDKVAHNGSR